MKLDAFAAKIETIAPLALQESWDHSGWQLRLTDGEIHRGDRRGDSGTGGGYPDPSSASIQSTPRS